MYLDMSALSSFLDELGYKKIKEFRIVPIYQQVQGNPVAFVNAAIVFTAADKNDILRYVEQVGRAQVIDEDGVKKLQADVLVKIREYMKKTKTSKLSARDGIYKYPSE